MPENVVPGADRWDTYEGAREGKVWVVDGVGEELRFSWLGAGEGGKGVVEKASVEEGSEHDVCYGSFLNKQLVGMFCKNNDCEYEAVVDSRKE